MSAADECTVSELQAHDLEQEAAPEAAPLSYLSKALLTANIADAPTYLLSAVSRAAGCTAGEGELTDEATAPLKERKRRSSVELKEALEAAEADGASAKAAAASAEEAAEQSQREAEAAQTRAAIDAAQLALVRAEEAEAAAMMSPMTSPFAGQASASFLQLWWHITGEGRGKSTLSWLEKVTSTLNVELPRPSPVAANTGCIWWLYIVAAYGGCI